MQGERRKAALWSLTMLLVLSVLAACSGGGANNAGAPAPAETPSGGGAESSADTGGQGTAEKAEAPKEPVELDIFVDFTWFAVDKFEGPIPEEITKRTGIKLNVTRASDANELPVMIASDNLPDLIYTDRLHDRLGDANISYAWDELIAQYAPDFDIRPVEIANNTMADGHFYTTLNAFATEEEWQTNPYALPSTGTRGLMLRADILEQLGNPPIRTLDDFEHVLAQVKERYPDMTPLLLAEYNDYVFEYFSRQMGLDVGIGTHIYERDGQVLYKLNHPAMLETYKLLNRFYRNGYISAENLTYGYEQYLQAFNMGNIFSLNRNASAASTDAMLANLGLPGTHVLAPSALSDKAVIVNDGIGWAGLYITKDNKDPEASIKFMQFMKSDEGQQLSAWGIEGDYWTLADEGYPIYADDKLEEMSADRVAYLMKHGINYWIFGMSAVTDGLRNYMGLDPRDVTALREAAAVTAYRPQLYFVKPTSADEEPFNIYTKLNDMVRNEQTKVVLAASEAEAVAAYEEMVRKAETIGMRDLEQWMTERYPAIMARYER